MDDRQVIRGLAALAAGLLASGLSSLLARFAILGAATHFANGFFDGLAVIAFAAAIFLLVRRGGAKAPRRGS